MHYNNCSNIFLKPTKKYSFSLSLKNLALDKIYFDKEETFLL